MRGVTKGGQQLPGEGGKAGEKQKEGPVKKELGEFGKVSVTEGEKEKPGGTTTFNPLPKRGNHSTAGEHLKHG